MTALYDRYSRVAYGLAYRILGRSAEADDVVQEAFLALWRQAERLDPARGLRSYLLTIVHHKAVDLLRRSKGLSDLGLEALDIFASDRPDPVEMATLSEERETVRTALRSLPGSQRDVLEMTYFGGLTAGEVARRMSLPVGTVKSRLRLALNRMRRQLMELR
jgi:RNA polymerase sigma-70 factor (ECF subfamily)